MSPQLWGPAVTSIMGERIYQMILPLAERLADPTIVLPMTQRLDASYWRDTSLTAGWPSLALFYHFLGRATQQQKWNDAARAYLVRAVEATHTRPLGLPCLSKGAAGLAFTISLFREADDQFETAQADLDKRLAQQILRHDWWGHDHDVSYLNYDLIVGVSGVLAYFTRRETHESAVKEATVALIRLLVQFVGYDPQPDKQRWAVPASFFPTAQQRQLKSPVINCGLAHGIPGPLAALALAWQAGYRAEGQYIAMKRLAYWLVEHHVQAPWGIDWPDVISASSSVEAIHVQQPARSGWCYGAPGVVRSLWLASEALSDDRIRHGALRGLDSILRRPVERRGIDPVTLCHGQAGLLIVLLHFFQETGRADVQVAIATLLAQILYEFCPESPVGFRYMFQPGQPVDSLGLLIGVSGTLLALLAASSDVFPAWDRALLLS